MGCSLKLCRAKFDEFSFLLPFPDLSHVSAVLFFPCVSLPVKAEILHRIQGFSSSCALQTGWGLAQKLS